MVGKAAGKAYMPFIAHSFVNVWAVPMKGNSSTGRMHFCFKF